MLLQSLIYSFQADTREVDKGIKKTEKGADDLTDALKKSEDQSRKTSQTLGMFAKAALGWLGAAASAGKAMSMAVQRAGEIDALDTLSLQLGTSITKTDALSRSIVGLGGSTVQAQSDLGRLSDALKERGQKPLEGMLNLSNRLAGMSYDRATRELKEYGITEKSTIELLRKGGSEIERMIKHQERNGAITVEAAEKAKRFNESLRGLRQVSSDAANGFAQFLMPALTIALDALTKVGRWMQDNKPFVIGFFIGVSAILAKMFLPAMIAVAGTVIAATWPFIAIGAAIGAAAAAFAFIYDDIMTFIDGGDSMIGMVLDKFPIVGEVITFVVDLIKTAFSMWLQSAKALWAGFASMADGIIGVFQWLWEGIKKYIDLIGKAVEKIKGAVGWVKGKLGFGDDADVTVSTMSKAEQEIRASGEAVPDAPQARQDADTVAMAQKEVAADNAMAPVVRQARQDIEGVSMAQREISVIADNPNAGMTTGAIRNAATGNQIEQNLAIGEITIETRATDAQGMASSTRSELQEQLQRMQANNATAITR